jgi:hypothetical protein
MKLFKLLPIAAAFVTLPSFAVGPQTNDVKIYAAGASAQEATLSNLMNKLCKPNVAPPAGSTAPVAGNVEYYEGYSINSSGAKTANSGLRAYRCDVIDGIGLNGKKVFFAYSSLDGSVSGVQYVIEQLDRSFINFTSACTTAGTLINNLAVAPLNSTKFTCNTGTTNAQLLAPQKPVAGASDVEPALFVGDNLPLDPATFEPLVNPVTPEGLAKLTIKQSRAVIFGLVANKHMILELQKKAVIERNRYLAAGAQLPIPTTVDLSSAARPSISKAEYRAIALGRFGNGISDLVTGSTGPLLLARRQNGSGSQAMSNVHFLNNPCGSNNLPSTALSPAAQDLTATGTQILEGGQTGDVRNAVRLATIPAIGVISLENAENTANEGMYYLKLDNVTPSKENAINGTYEFYAEESLQWNNQVATADQVSFLTAYALRNAELATLQSLTAANQAGVAALAQKQATPTLPSANHTWYLKSERSGDNCKPATWVN